MKVDNGAPLGDPLRKSIPPLGLWLISLGVEMIWNRPAQPTDNAKVERMQATSARWAEVKHCPTIEHLRKRLVDVALTQRELYEVSRLGYQTRKNYYPGLYTNASADAKMLFDPSRAYHFLAQTRLVRRVGTNGQVSLYGYGYQVGQRFKRQEIGIGFDPKTCAWRFYDRADQQIRQSMAKTMTPDHIWSLSVCKRTKKLSS